MSVSIKITDLEKLQRELEDAQRAFESLDGTIATLRFNADDPESVEEAIRQMEAAVDARVAPYRGNALVSTVAQKLRISGKDSRNGRRWSEMTGARLSLNVTPSAGGVSAPHRGRRRA